MFARTFGHCFPYAIIGVSFLPLDGVEWFFRIIALAMAIAVSYKTLSGQVNPKCAQCPFNPNATTK